MEAVSMLKWTDPSMDTTRIGWITTINPTFDNREQSQIRFCKVALYSKLLAKKVKIPMFQMSFVSPTAEKDRNTISTKAYAIKVLVSEISVHMLHVLKTLLSDVVTSFVPYSMRSKYPAVYIQAIKYQTQSKNATRVVVLQNISEAMMFSSSLVSARFQAPLISLRLPKSTTMIAIPYWLEKMRSRPFGVLLLRILQNGSLRMFRVMPNQRTSNLQEQHGLNQFMTMVCPVEKILGCQRATPALC